MVAATTPEYLDRQAHLLAFLPKLKGTTTKVAVSYVFHANSKTGQAWPNTATIAAETGLAPTVVRAARRELKALGFLEEVLPHRGTKSGRYLVAPGARRGDISRPRAVRDRLGDDRPEESGESSHPERNVPLPSPGNAPTRNETCRHQQTNTQSFNKPSSERQRPITPPPGQSHRPGAGRVGLASTKRAGFQMTIMDHHLAFPDELHQLAVRCCLLDNSEYGRKIAHEIAAHARRCGKTNRCGLARRLLEGLWKEYLNARDEREAQATLFASQDARHRDFAPSLDQVPSRPEAPAHATAERLTTSPYPRPLEAAHTEPHRRGEPEALGSVLAGLCLG